MQKRKINYLDGKTPQETWKIGMSAGRDNAQITKDLKLPARKAEGSDERRRLNESLKFAKTQVKLMENVY